MIERKVFNEIDAASLQAHIDNGIKEGPQIDYKQETYGGADADKKEFLKDISAFANTSGGHLVIGMSEDDGIPDAITPLVGIDVDAELLRLESLARDGLQPRILGIEMGRVAVPGGDAIVIRVPKSWNPPHRVQFKGTNRFYARNSSGVYELDVEELRSVFTRRISIEERAKEFLRGRNELLELGRTLIPTEWGKGVLAIHLIPLADVGSGRDFDVVEAQCQIQNLQPIGGVSTSSRFNLEGLCIYDRSQHRRAYTQLYRSGIVESVVTQISVQDREGDVDGLPPRIPGFTFSEWILSAIQRYMAALQAIGASAPIMISISLFNVSGLRLKLSDDYDFGNQVIQERSSLIVPPVMVESYGEAREYGKPASKLLDIVWNAFNYESCVYFEKGVWVGRNRR